MDDVLHHASSVRTKSKRTWKPNSTRSHAKQCGVIGVHHSPPAAARMHACMRVEGPQCHGRQDGPPHHVFRSWVSSHSSTSRHLIITLRWWWWSALTLTGHLHKSYVLCFWAIHGTALEASCIQVQANGGAPKLFLVPILSLFLSPLQIMTGDHIISCAWKWSMQLHHTKRRKSSIIRGGRNKSANECSIFPVSVKNFWSTEGKKVDVSSLSGLQYELREWVTLVGCSQCMPTPQNHVSCVQTTTVQLIWIRWVVLLYCSKKTHCELYFQHVCHRGTQDHKNDSKATAVHMRSRPKGTQVWDAWEMFYGCHQWLTVQLKVDTFFTSPSEDLR